ncbi:MAG: hypothetical protein V9G19_14835 [Tetrasphaera sp.]
MGEQDALWAYPDLPVDPALDIVAGTLPVPPLGDYTLQVLRGPDVIAETGLSVRTCRASWPC